MENTKRKTTTVEEAAEILGISVGAAYEAVRRGDIYAARVGRRIIIPTATIERLTSDKGEK